MDEQMMENDKKLVDDWKIENMNKLEVFWKFPEHKNVLDIIAK